jgi:hypothetical protein
MKFKKKEKKLTRAKQIEAEVHQQSIIHNIEVLEETKVKSKASMVHSKKK